MSAIAKAELITAVILFFVFIYAFNIYLHRRDNRYFYFAVSYLALSIYFSLFSVPYLFTQDSKKLEIYFHLSYFSIFVVFAFAIKFTAITVKSARFWNLFAPIAILITGIVMVISMIFTSDPIRTYVWYGYVFAEPIINPFFKYVTGIYAFVAAISFSRIFWPYLKSEKKVLRVRSTLSSIGVFFMPLSGAVYYFGTAIFQNGNIVPILMISDVVFLIGIFFVILGLSYGRKLLTKEERRVFRPIGSRNLSLATEVDISTGS